MSLRYDPSWRLVRYERQSRKAYERRLDALAIFAMSTILGGLSAGIILLWVVP